MMPNSPMSSKMLMQNPYQISPPGLKNHNKDTSSKKKLEKAVEKPSTKFSQNKHQEKKQSALFDEVIESDPKMAQMILK